MNADYRRQVFRWLGRGGQFEGPTTNVSKVRAVQTLRSDDRNSPADRPPAGVINRHTGEK
jgi:hypothetical protein